MTSLTNNSSKIDPADIPLKRKNNYALGTIGAILGALIGSVPWAIAYYFGWFAGILGFLIGFCAVKGYKIFKGKPGLVSIIIIILAIIIGVIAGQVIGDFISIALLINSGDIVYATFSDIPELYIFLLKTNSEALSSMLFNLGLGFVFAFLGVIKLLKDMISELQNSKATNNVNLGSKSGGAIKNEVQNISSVNSNNNATEL